MTHGHISKERYRYKDMINIIAAINNNGGIGKDNKLLYRIPNDMKRFKTLTTGHTVIMGRKTFESLPKGALPNRRNIVLSHRETSFENAESFHSLRDALEACKSDEEIFIIGGESLYKEAMPIADRLYITEIDDTKKEADAFFPDIDLQIWKVKETDSRPKDEKHSYEYRFVDYIRRG